MRTISVLFFVTVMSVGAAGQKMTEIQDFGGMSGCWERRDDAKKLLNTEYWMSPAGTSMLGMGRTVKDGKTTGWEFMRIEKRADGFYFVSRPHENKEDTAFKLLSSDEDSVTFENKEHDFPRRVIYWRDGESLMARIEGTINGQPRSRQWRYDRVK